MKRELICFILSVAIVLIVGYGVVAPVINKKESVKVATQQTVEKTKSEQQEKVDHARSGGWRVESSWVNEYNIYGSIKDINIKK